MTAATTYLPTATSPEAGDPAPDANVQAIDGGTISLSILWANAEQGLALVFLRHFGCPFCKEHARAIESGKAEFESAGITVAYVGCSTSAEAQAFTTDLNLTSSVYNDPERVAYQAYGIGEAATGSMFNPRVLVGGVRAAARGFLPKRSSGNPLQLQGQFLIDRNGIIRSVSRPALMSEIPTASSLLADAQLLGGSR